MNRIVITVRLALVLRSTAAAQRFAFSQRTVEFTSALRASRPTNRHASIEKKRVSSDTLFLFPLSDGRIFCHRAHRERSVQIILLCEPCGKIVGNLSISNYTPTRLCDIACASERKISRPSFDPRSSSHALSGCGIIPSTFRSRLQMPAMLDRAPFGFDSGVVSPLSSQYRNTIWLFSSNEWNVASSQV